MKLTWRSAWIGPALGLASAGCSSTTHTVMPAQPAAATEIVTPASGPPVADEDPAALALVDHHRHRHGGFVMFLLMSLDSLGATPDQSAAFDRIKADLRSQMKPELDAQAALLDLLADGVAAGSVDPSRVDAAVAAITTTSNTTATAATRALDELHAMLTPPQREAVADKLQAHFEVWREANSDTESAGSPPDGGRLAALAKAVGLTPDQIDKVRSSFTSAGAGRHFNPSEGAAFVRAFGDAFASDTFDAAAVPGEDRANGRLAGTGAAAMARFYEALAPVLTTDQREQVATGLRDRANRATIQAGA